MQEQETLQTRTREGHDETLDEGELVQARLDESELVEELLIEEISIDGMCGVY